MASLTLKGRPEVLVLPDGRRRITHVFDVLAPALEAANLGTPASPGPSAVMLAWGTAEPDFTGARLIRQYAQRAPQNAGEQTWVRVYEEIPATAEVQVGQNAESLDSDGRKVITAQFLQFTAGTYSAGSIGVTTAPGDANAVLDSVSKVDDGTLRTITRRYIQATGSVVQIGLPTVQSIAGAYKSDGGGGYKPAREFTYRYLVAGDGTADGNWLSLNTQLSTTGRYLVDQFIAHRGVAHAIISRVYVELPDSFTYGRPMTFQFPGVYGNNPPLTKQDVNATVVESYSLTEPSLTALGYDPTEWCTVFTSYTPSDPPGADAIDFSQYFPGYLSGGYSFVATNTTFQGIACDSVNITSSSVPTNPPTGATVVRSIKERWRGLIWKKTNVSVTFP